MTTFLTALCVLGPTLLVAAFSCSKRGRKYCSRIGGCCGGICNSSKGEENKKK